MIDLAPVGLSDIRSLCIECVEVSGRQLQPSCDIPLLNLSFGEATPLPWLKLYVVYILVIVVRSLLFEVCSVDFDISQQPHPVCQQTWLKVKTKQLKASHLKGALRSPVSRLRCLRQRYLPHLRIKRRNKHRTSLLVQAAVV